MDNIQEKIETIRNLIKKESLILKGQKIIINPHGNSSSWLFDLRNIFLKPASIDLITDIFWNIFEKEYPFQVGGQEVAAIPLISAIVMKSALIGKPVNGFFIRKSRKPIGLQKIVEGEINEEKIILVDDLINSGTTVFRQTKTLGLLGKKVDIFFTLINFRGEENIKKLEENNIKLVSLFELPDFGLSFSKNDENIFKETFETIWRFESPNPQFHQRIPKSTPCLDKDKIYFGNDSGYFWALHQTDGTIAWKFKTGYAFQKKYIYSSPAIHKKWIYFGAYDGNIYAINKETGKLKWKNFDADYIGSSPAISPSLNLLFIGCQYGFFNKKGGILALNLETGKKIWDYQIPSMVESSPAFCLQKNAVAIGSNGGFVYLFNASDGKLKWKFKTGGPIKASFCFNLERNLLLFGSYDKSIYALNIDSGKIEGKFSTMDIVYSTPTVLGKNVYFTSLDKNIYSLDIETGKLNWRFEVGGRIFSSPKIFNNKIYFGSTDGRMYEIDLENKKKSYFQTLERITDDIVYNAETKRFFVTNYANEVYCLEKMNSN
jgi:outer membrane protein assembly factor BamB